MARDSHTDGTGPARSAGWTPLHETDPGLVGDHAGGGGPPGDGNHAGGGDPAAAGGGQVAETGTTVVGVTTHDVVVLAADRRASVGGGRFVSNKDVRKVEPVHPSAAAALSGAVGHIQHYVRVLRAESGLYEDRRGEEMTMRALSTLSGNVLRSSPLYVTPLLGGVDADGPALFGLDGGGGVLGDDYAAGGSGMQVAYGVLEREYEAGLSPADARGLAARAVDAASERDTASGNGFTVATVTGEGVDVDGFDALAEVAA